MSSFKELIHANVTKSDYLKLSGKLKITQKKLTRGENNPSEFSVKSLRQLSKILGIQPYILIRDYGVAVNNISLSDLDLLNISITPKSPKTYEKSSSNRTNRKQNAA